MSSVKKSLILGTLAFATALAGCGGGDDGGAGTGAVNPTAGTTGGTNPMGGGAAGMNPMGGGMTSVGGMSGGAAGTNPTGGVGGMSMAGTSGGTGVAGGEPLMCTTDMDIRTGHMCDEEAEGWFAIKTKIDVWWQGTPVRDPGRGDIDVYLLGHLDGVCNDGSNGVGTIKACGTVLPPFTSDVACDAFQIEFPNELWDSGKMPRYGTTGSVTMFEPGGLLTLNAAMGLVGINLMDATQEMPSGFPDATQTGTFMCDDETGTHMGVDCFPDHDDDTFPGVTIRLRTDAATYMGPYGDGKCTNGTEYKYRGAPTLADIGAGGGAGGGVRAQFVRIGLRTRLGGAGLIGADCMSGVGDSQATFLDSRAWECLVDPSTVPAEDPHPDNKCTAAEATFVDENVPAYQVLAKDGVPGDSMPPIGWGLAGRDIDKTASVGPRSALVRLGNLTDAEPSCEMVRTAAYPAL